MKFLGQTPNVHLHTGYILMPFLNQTLQFAESVLDYFDFFFQEFFLNSLIDLFDKPLIHGPKTPFQ